MCFSVEADLVAAAVIAPIGVATLTQVRHRDEIVIGVLPLLFALHQFTEAFVWAGLEGDVSRPIFDAATRIYLVFAQAVLPALVPVGLYLLEPSRGRRRRILPFVPIGLATGGYLLFASGLRPIDARADDHLIIYQTAVGIPYYVAAGYVAATCAPALLQGERYLREFGVVNVVGVLLAGGLASQAFASVWCVYAALTSLLILLHFRRQRGRDARHPLGAGRREALRAQPAA